VVRGCWIEIWERLGIVPRAAIGWLDGALIERMVWSSSVAYVRAGLEAGGDQLGATGVMIGLLASPNAVIIATFGVATPGCAGPML
jgi:hypothetical protein